MTIEIYFDFIIFFNHRLFAIKHIIMYFPVYAQQYFSTRSINYPVVKIDKYLLLLLIFSFASNSSQCITS